MNPLAITDYTLTTALGVGLERNWSQLSRGEGGLRPCTFAGINDLDTWVGEVAGLDVLDFPREQQSYDCRNNRLALMGLGQDGFTAAVSAAAARYGAERVAVFIGTSTSGIHETELAYRSLIPDGSGLERLPDEYCYEGSHNTYSVAEFVRRMLGLRGPCSAVSTACSSSAKVFACAHRAIEAGFCDAAVVGGVDTLCLTTLYGFHSLQLVASDICRPSDSGREGLSIGEAAGFALVQRGDATPRGMRLLGYGESSDAFHMSSPHPEGDGAAIAMRTALERSGLSPESIDYINLHGTGTRGNDTVEAAAVCRIFPAHTPCSSTKGFTGHTLGAAGIVEAVFALQCIEHHFMPETLNTRYVDPDIRACVLLQSRSGAVGRVMSNSFGFGGSNCSLVLSGSDA